MPISCLLPDPLPRFRAIYEALNSQRSWSGDSSALRFAALTAITCPGDPQRVAAAITSKARKIRENTGWFNHLHFRLRYIVSALLVMHEDHVDDLLSEVDYVHSLFRDLGLRYGGIYETMAIITLRINNNKEPIERNNIIRFKAIYEEMKKYHWWLTGPDDFPACAMLVFQRSSPQEIGFIIENIYQNLHQMGFTRSDALQHTANILYLAHVDPEIITQRYYQLAQGFRDAGISIWQEDYDELAVLSFLDVPAQQIIETTLRYREEVNKFSPIPNSFLAFNFASDLTFLEFLRKNYSERSEKTRELVNLQMIINAQSAAILSCCR